MVQVIANGGRKTAKLFCDICMCGEYLLGVLRNVIQTTQAFITFR
jgi:hypothetical protein